MGITRRLPNSDKQRLIVLREAKKKKDSLPASQVNEILRPSTAQQLDELYAAYKDAYQERLNTLADQIGATQTVVDKAKYLRTICSQFLQIIKFRIDRGTEPTHFLSYFGFAQTNQPLPTMSTEAELRNTAELIINGDTARVAAGGGVMHEISVAEIQAALSAWNTATDVQSNRKDSFNQSQETLSQRNAGIDIFMKKLYDEIESAYNSADIASNRRNAREWGVLYVSTEASCSIEGVITSAITGEPLANVVVALPETEETTFTAADGSYRLTTVFIGSTTLSVRKEGYLAIEKEVTLADNTRLAVNFALVKEE